MGRVLLNGDNAKIRASSSTYMYTYKRVYRCDNSSTNGSHGDTTFRAELLTVELECFLHSFFTIILCFHKKTRKIDRND